MLPLPYPTAPQGDLRHHVQAYAPNLSSPGRGPEGPRQRDISANRGFNEHPFKEVSDAGYLSLSAPFVSRSSGTDFLSRGGFLSHNPCMCFRYAGSFATEMCRHRRPQSVTIFSIQSSVAGSFATEMCRHRRPQSVTIFSILSLVVGSFTPEMCRHRHPQSVTIFCILSSVAGSFSPEMCQHRCLQ
ncbi:UNVERIFIED_CONTAM: hypothetical protein FKN15_053950 [Acipenser sinensis]